MKKLLAIAVAAAFAAPMMASAEVTVGGNLNQEYDFGALAAGGTENIADDGGDNEIVIKASTPLNNGMTGTVSINHEFNAADGSDGRQETNGKLGIKGGFGHLTIGNVSEPQDAIDGVVGFMPNDFSYANGKGDQGINYTGAFGGITAMALVRPQGRTLTGTENQIGLIYKAGPIAAGLGVSNTLTATEAKTRLALAYNGANYSVGVMGDKAEGGAKSVSVGGKYSFGKAYVSASLGKTGGAKGNAVKVGYALGKSTEIYFQSDKKVSSAGVASDGVAASDRSHKIGINQKF